MPKNSKEGAPVDRAVGAELTLARNGFGLTRKQVVTRMAADSGDVISDQTLANYEYGIRPCTLERLDSICRALGVRTSTLVALALQRCGLEENPDVVLVDLHAVVATRAADLESLRQWAAHRLKSDLDETVMDNGVARVQRSTLVELAAFFGCTYAEMCRRLRRFLPAYPPPEAARAR